MKGAGESGEWSGLMKGTWVLDNTFVELNWTIVLAEKKASAKALITYDASQKAYRGVFFISNEATPMVTKGKIEGTKLVLVGGPSDDEQVHCRFIFDNLGNGALSLALSVENPTGGSAFGGTFKRK